MGSEDDFWFPGFEEPTYTPIPDVFFDGLAPHLSESELRVLLYVMRRTFGFKKRADAISLSQLEKGIVTKDGRVLDEGTGMARSSVRRGCKGLVEKGVLTVTKVQSEDGEYETNVYTLRFRDTEVGSQRSYPRIDTLPPVGAQSSLQETVIQETVEQETDFEIRNSNGTDPDSGFRRAFEGTRFGRARRSGN